MDSNISHTLCLSGLDLVGTEEQLQRMKLEKLKVNVTTKPPWKKKPAPSLPINV